MYMTEREIVGRFNRGEDKKEQVKILAQLNACDESEIREILLRNGVGLEEALFPPKKRGRKPGQKNSKPKAVSIEPHVEESKPEDPVESVGMEKIAITVLAKDVPQEVVESMEREMTPIPTDRVVVIPETVRRLCAERVCIITDEIMRLEKERDTLQDFLMGVG